MQPREWIAFTHDPEFTQSEPQTTANKLSSGRQLNYETFFQT